MAEIEATPAEQVVRVTVSADAGLLPPVIEFVKQMTSRLGLGDIGQIEGAVELVCMNVIEHAFAPEEDGSFDVHVLRGPGRVVVAVEDQGLPFDYSRLQAGEDGTVLETLHMVFDEVRFVNLGRRGNRVEEPGDDLAELVHRHLSDLSLHRVDCVYVDLPLSDPATPGATAGLENLGVFFGGLIPEAHAGGGDVLRLQYLNNVEVQPGDVSTASDFGEELLDLIFRQSSPA